MSNETLRMETPEPGRILLGSNLILRQRYRLDGEIGRGGMGSRLISEIQILGNPRSVSLEGFDVIADA